MLDLRGNPGGYLDRATRLADEFIARLAQAGVHRRQGRPVRPADLRPRGRRV
ncbi:MAG: S41 family peptidase [Hymenobacter sp.]